MEGSEVTHHLVVHILLVCVDGLGVLPEVVESGEVFAAVTVEGALPGVFSGDNGEG